MARPCASDPTNPRQNFGRVGGACALLPQRGDRARRESDEQILDARDLSSSGAVARATGGAVVVDRAGNRARFYRPHGGRAAPIGADRTTCACRPDRRYGESWYLRGDGGV